MKIPTVIRIKKRRLSGRLIWLLVLMPFGFALLTELLPLPYSIRYLLDPVWLLLAVLSFRYGAAPPRLLARWVAGFSFALVLTGLLKTQSVLYLLWGLRNNFRHYAVFFALCAFLTAEEGNHYLDTFQALFRINIPITLFQYFILGRAGDYLGGIFGTGQGCNAYTNVFFCIVVARAQLLFLEGTVSGKSCLKTCFWALLLAALAELKFFFLEFGAITVMAVVFSGFSRRKLWMLLGAALGILAGAALLGFLFPTFRGWFSTEWLLDAAGSDRGYTSSGDLNRLNSIFKINRWFFHRPGIRLLGLGLGNCETSGFPFLNTPFYRAYGHIHYTWMSVSFWYLECGYLGLVFFFGFFLLIFLTAGRMEKRGKSACHCHLARIMAVLCCMIGIYNASLRTEAAYMVYFVLALPFLQQRRSR